MEKIKIYSEDEAISLLGEMFKLPSSERIKHESLIRSATMHLEDKETARICRRQIYNSDYMIKD